MNTASNLCDSALIEFYREHIQSSDQPMLVICNDNDHAERIVDTLSFATNASLVTIPDNETLPYDEENPLLRLTSERLNGINKLINFEKGNSVFIIPARSLIERICDAEIYKPVLEFDDRNVPDKKDIAQTLNNLGYSKRNTVTSMGEYAINTCTMDLFPIGHKAPVRIFFENKPEDIGQLSEFSVDTQLIEKTIHNVKIFPLYEFPFDNDSILRARGKYRRLLKETDSPFFKKLKDASETHDFPRGVDYYRALFSNDMRHISELLPANTKVVSAIDIESHIDRIHDHFNRRYNEIFGRPILPVTDIIAEKEEIMTAFKKLSFVEISVKSKRTRGILASDVQKQEKVHETVKLISAQCDKVSKTLITINSSSRMSQLEMMLNMKKIEFRKVKDWSEFEKQKKGVFVTKADLDIGFRAIRQDYSIITELEIFASKTMDEMIYDSNDSKSSVLNLEKGQPIVHAKYGVGRFIGFNSYEDKHTKREFVILEYAEKATIWVPLDELGMLSEYKGIELETTPLDKASSKNWNKTLLSTIGDIKQLAKKLIKIKAKREGRKREPFKVPAYEYRKFSSEFPFVPTKDQSNAIIDILNDMKSDISMDRVVVGDVGYGKTEIAMRAAMISAFNKRQSCIIAPTTLLAEQHYQTFQSRFSSFNFKIELLTSDKKSSEKDALRRLQAGEIDIIIGTHRLIQKDVEFKNLGLFVIDEEHRFGVKQKEMINEQRGNTDILSLSATPIPRTLSMTMHGIRDISTINTAPMKRLAVRTVASDFDDDVIKDAIGREIGRNGQVFYLHNNTSTIDEAASRIEALFPEAKVAVAHGKLKEIELQKTMSSFRSHEYDILVATTIIETGIDIPNANTIILTECDKLGLAQMHQLRGRVGRSNKQAYAYLLRPKERAMSEIAKKRVSAMVNNTNLGGGFKISNADLEIRGAGEILGENQSGHIQDIGYQMYFALLQQALEILESNGNLEDMNYSGDSLIFHVPDSYNIPASLIDNEGLRAVYYRALAEASESNDFEKIILEMEHRFGTIPDEVFDLVNLYKGKANALKSGLRKSKLEKDTITLTFDSKDNASIMDNNLQNLGIAHITTEANTISITKNHLIKDGVVDYSKLALSVR